MSLCENCIHENACKAQYQIDSGYFNFEEETPTCFEDTTLFECECDMYEDKSYIFHPKYRLDDCVWTFVYDDKDWRKPVGVGKVYICGIEYDNEGFSYRDCDYIRYDEEELFASKEDAEAAIKKKLEV